MRILPGVMKKEIKRKAFHFLSLVYAAGYFFLERGTVLEILGTLLAVESCVEFGRFLVPGFNQKLVGIFGGIHREEEVRRASGIFWTLLGSFLTMLLFRRREVVLCAMGFLVFGDAAAALVGIQFGKHRIFHGKSLEGSLAFFLVSLAVGLFFFSPLPALVGAFLATLVELIPLPYNDNLWIPLVSALLLTFVA